MISKRVGAQVPEAMEVTAVALVDRNGFARNRTDKRSVSK
jgi:hypothetical protein